MRHFIAIALASLAYVLGAASISSAQDTSPVLIGRHMTVGAGATVVATLAEAVARAEDSFVPHRLFAENGVPRRTANLLFRMVKRRHRYSAAPLSRIDEPRRTARSGV